MPRKKRTELRSGAPAAKEPKEEKKEPKAAKRVINAYLVGYKVIIKDDYEGAQSIHDKGYFGEFIEEVLELSLYEGLFLLEKGRVKVFDGRKKEISFRAFMGRAKKHDFRFYTRYSIYRDIRKRGYITKAALKYGADFSIYPRGKNPKNSHSRWLLFAVSADELFDWRKFAAMNRVAHSVRKKLMIGIVDAMSDVTYYEIKWKRP